MLGLIAALVYEQNLSCLVFHIAATHLPVSSWRAEVLHVLF